MPYLVLLPLRFAELSLLVLIHWPHDVR
ncbi:hypothetical protein VCHC55A1_2303, partial [Vibrio cholerae HC-55A1]